MLICGDLRFLGRPGPDSIPNGVWLLTAPVRTEPHRTAPGPYQAENDWLFHFNDCYE